MISTSYGNRLPPHQRDQWHPQTCSHHWWVGWDDRAEMGLHAPISPKVTLHILYVCSSTLELILFFPHSSQTTISTYYPERYPTDWDRPCDRSGGAFGKQSGSVTYVKYLKTIRASDLQQWSFFFFENCQHHLPFCTAKPAMLISSLQPQFTTINYHTLLFFFYHDEVEVVVEEISSDEDSGGNCTWK